MVDFKQLSIGFIFGATSAFILVRMLEKYDPFGLPFPFGKKETDNPWSALKSDVINNINYKD